MIHIWFYIYRPCTKKFKRRLLPKLMR